MRGPREWLRLTCTAATLLPRPDGGLASLPGGLERIVPGAAAAKKSPYAEAVICSAYSAPLQAAVYTLPALGRRTGAPAPRGPGIAAAAPPEVQHARQPPHGDAPPLLPNQRNRWPLAVAPLYTAAEPRRRSGGGLLRLRERVSVRSRAVTRPVEPRGAAAPRGFRVSGPELCSHTGQTRNQQREELAHICIL